MREATISRLLRQSVETMPAAVDAQSALARLLDCLEEDTADCIDNSGRPYQSQALWDAIRAARRVMSPGDPQP